DLWGPSVAAEPAGKTRRAPHMDVRRFPQGQDAPSENSRRLREPGAQHRARRRGVLSLRQVSLHKQRKVARAVTARKLLTLNSAQQQAGQDPPYDASRRQPEKRVGGVTPTYGAVGVAGGPRR